MKTMKFTFIGLFLLFAPSIDLKAQDFQIQNVKSEIQSAALKEQLAFKEGNCAEVMEENITFLANGKTIPSKSVVAKFCNSLKRPFAEPTVDKLEVFPITPESGYTIRTLEYPKDEKTKMVEYVTKIWRKTEGTWKICHLHSTVNEIGLSK